MKILHVINNLGTGGAEVMLCDIIKSLQIIDTKTNIDVLILNNKRLELLSEYKNANINIIHLNMKSNYDLLKLFKFYFIAKKYDVIHSHLFPSNFYIGLFKLFNKKMKIITTEHNTSNKRRNLKLFKILDKFFYSKYNAIICITDAVQINLDKWIKLKDKSIYKIIYNGIDLKKFSSPINDDNSQKSNFDIIMVGSFTQQKDQITVINSLQYLPDEINLTLIGDGFLRSRIENRILELGLNKRVNLLGIQNNINEHFKKSDIVIVSSIWEGFGLVAVEGMASNKPVIATNVDGLKQIVENHGLLFKVKNEKELAKYIKNLYSDNVYYKEIQNRCYERSKSFSVDITSKNYLRLYKEMYEK